MTKERITITVSKETLELVDRYCRLVGCSRSGAIDAWIKEAYPHVERVLSMFEASAVNANPPSGNNGGHNPNTARKSRS